MEAEEGKVALNHDHHSYNIKIFTLFTHSQTSTRDHDIHDYDNNNGDYHHHDYDNDNDDYHHIDYDNDNDDYHHPHYDQHDDQAAPAAANGSAAEPAAGEPAKKTVSCCFVLFCCFTRKQ